MKGGAKKANGKLIMKMGPNENLLGI